MKTKLHVALGIFAVVFALNLCAFAQLDDQVEFKGQFFCTNIDNCPNFANWGATAADTYVVLYEADGHTISDYLWINSTGEMTFESRMPDGLFGEPLPPGFIFEGGLIENGSLQDLGQFLPGELGSGRTLLVESKVDTTVPEPSTLLLVGPAALFLFGRARRFWRA